MVVEDQDAISRACHFVQDRALVAEIDQDHMSVSNIWRRALIDAELDIFPKCLPDCPCSSKSVSTVSMINAQWCLIAHLNLREKPRPFWRGGDSGLAHDTLLPSAGVNGRKYRGADLPGFLAAVTNVNVEHHALFRIHDLANDDTKVPRQRCPCRDSDLRIARKALGFRPEPLSGRSLDPLLIGQPLAGQRPFKVSSAGPTCAV